MSEMMKILENPVGALQVLLLEEKYSFTNHILEPCKLAMRYCTSDTVFISFCCLDAFK